MTAWIMHAKPGDKVQCIRDAWEWNGVATDPAYNPRQGEIYTIASIDADCCGVFFMLEEAISGDWYEWVGFRPLQSRSSDISIFTNMLKSAPAPVEEVA